MPDDESIPQSDAHVDSELDAAIGSFSGDRAEAVAFELAEKYGITADPDEPLSLLDVMSAMDDMGLRDTIHWARAVSALHEAPELL